MNKEQHKVKVIAINRTIDRYFALESESKSPDLVIRFMEWMDNGEFEEEKNAALFRKFEEICDEQFNQSDEEPLLCRGYSRNNGSDAGILYS